MTVEKSPRLIGMGQHNVKFDKNKNGDHTLIFAFVNDMKLTQNWINKRRLFKKKGVLKLALTCEMVFYKKQ